MNRFVMPCLLAAGALAAPAPAGAQTQSYPNRPIRFIIPFPPGGSTDTYGRILGAKLAELLGQQVVIDNRAGAGGGLGADIAAKSAPDGYNIVLGQDGNIVIGPAVRTKQLYDPLTDFSPISLVVRTPQVIVVNDASPVRSLQDLVGAAKAKPGALTYATAGIAGSGHATGMLFNGQSGIDTVHVPYKGGGPAMLDLRAGRVSYMVTSLVSAIGSIKDGRVRALASTGAKRSHLLPDTPTVAESGFPGFESILWHGVLGPAKLPREIVARLNREIVKALAMPEVQKLLQAEGGVVSPSTPEEFQAFLRVEVPKWAKIMKQAGVTID
jgi:tripartite-type tricarboxylate transporter receptor subunit TctC